MLKKFISILGLLIIAGLSYGVYYFSPVLNAGSGFSAKNICSGYFLSGMSGQVIVEEALVPAAPILSNISFNIDTVKQQVDTNIFGFFNRRAVFSEGTGCTLLSAGQKKLERTLEVTAVSQPGNRSDWPQRTLTPSQKQRLVPVLAQAFAEPDPQHLRNTKAVVVIHKGRLVAEKYAHGIRSDTPLIGWSMTKSITNLLIGLLVKDGSLSLKQAAH